MTNLARLGFSVDTNDVSLAAQNLKKLVPAASAADTAATKLQNTFVGLGTAATKVVTGSAKAGSALLNATTNVDRFNKSALSTSTAMVTVATMQSKMANGFNQIAAGAANAEKTTGVLNAELTKTQGAFSLLYSMMRSAATAYDTVAAKTMTLVGANDAVAASNQRVALTIGAVRANNSNLMAQFQDVGVTAAMGMNPFLIAMQQGTQVALVLKQSVGAGGLLGGIRDLGKAFLSSLGPVTLFSIAIVGVGAALLQMVTWSKVAASSLNFLADHLETIAIVSGYAAATIALMYAPSIITGILKLSATIGTTLIAAVVKATAFMVAFSLANPWGAFVLGVSAVIAAMLTFSDFFSELFGTDVVKAIKNGANFIIASFVGAFNTVKKTWKMFPAAIGDYMIMAVNNVLNAVTKMVNGSVKGINFILSKVPGQLKIGEFSGFEISNPFEGTIDNIRDIALAEYGKAAGVDWVDGLIAGAKSKIKGASDWLRKIASGLGADKDKDKKSKRDPWADMQRDAGIQIASLQNELATLDLVGVAAERAAARQELLNRAKREGIPLTKEVVSQIDSWANAIGQLRNSIASEQAFLNMSRDMQESISMIAQESATILMNVGDMAAVRMARQLYNDEIYRGIILTDQQKNALIELARSEALAAESLSKLNERVSTAKGAFSDLLNGMRNTVLEGKSIWSAFADSIINSLKRVSDYLFNNWIDQAFKMGTSGSGGGPLGGIFKSLGLNFFADGGVFGGPTAFSYAGGKAGILGEKGPEAVMPLKRGPDGSLGVQMHNAVNQSAPTVTVIVQAEEGEMFRPVVEAIADDRAVNVVTIGLDQFNSQLPDRMHEISNDPRLR